MNKQWLSIFLIVSMLASGSLAEELPPAPPAQEQSAELPGEAQQPDDTQTPEETQQPDETQVPEESPAPDETQLPGESPEPDATATPDPDGGSAAPEPSLAPSPTPAVEGYLLDAQGAKVQGGMLAELLKAEGPLRLCVSTPEQILIRDFPLHRLQEIEFLPDPEQVSVRFRVVLSASEFIEDEYTVEDIEAFEEDTLGDLYIWLQEELPEPSATPTPEAGLRVIPEDYFDGRWSCVPPTFTLEGIAEDDSASAYAAIILDERIAILSGDSYLPLEEGEYSVRFAIMDAMGDIVDRSENYNLRLDFTPPVLGIDVSMEADRTMTLYLADALSGVDALSLDGGESWIALDGAESFPYTASEKQSFAPGAILLRDVAGNLAANPEEIVLDKIPSMSGGGGGGGGDSTPKKQHASGDGDDAQYNAYQLELPEGAVQALNLGDEEIDLHLEVLDDAGTASAGSFRASFLRWARAADAAQVDTQEGAQDPDTLLLTAQTALENCERVWKINGAVLRKLYNSDVRYLLLDSDAVRISLPTQGFTAGTRYAQLKMEGTSTAEFNYEIHMRRVPDGEAAPSPASFNCALDWDVQIWVEVAGERFEMKDRLSTPEMYPCDVYCAPEDLINYPYGAYPAFADGAETEA